MDRFSQGFRIHGWPDRLPHHRYAREGWAESLPPDPGRAYSSVRVILTVRSSKTSADSMVLRIDPLIGMILDIIDCKGHILGAEWLFVVPGHFIAKMKYIGLLICQVLPALCQSGDKSVLVFPDESIEYQAHADVARTAGVMAVGRWSSPSLLWSRLW